MGCTQHDKRSLGVFPGAQAIARALVTVLHLDNNRLTDQTLQKLFIHTSNADACPSPESMPLPNLHPSLDPETAETNDPALRNPQDCCAWPGSTPFTGLEWASLFHDTACKLSHLDAPATTAKPRDIQWGDEWEKLMGDGERKQPNYWHVQWKAISMLETGGFSGCIVADNSHGALPAGVPYKRSELACLLALVCRDACQNPSKSLHMPTVISFTRTTARVLQASVRLPKCSNPTDQPTMHVFKRLEVPIHQVVTSNNDPRQAYKEWLDVVAWLCFGPPRIPKHSIKPSVASDTSTTTFSESSDDWVEGPKASDASSTRSSIGSGSPQQLS